VVAAPHRHHRKGVRYNVRIDLTVPGREIVVNRDQQLDHAHEDVFVAIRDAFRAVRRRLEDHARRQRGDVKAHASPSVGRICRLFPDGGYGFISTPNGGEVYFHRNSLLDASFERLTVGTPVRFSPELAGAGLNAASVRVE
jgi:cold shock CspA family protein